jgi:hypothetical protein
LNISDNDIGKLSPDASKLDAADWKYKKAKSGNMAYFKDGKGQREAPTECLSPLGAIALANAIPDMEALMSLNISNNKLVPPESISMKPPRQGLKEGDLVDEKTVTKIYLSGNICLTDFSAIVALADGIKNNRALTSLHVGNNNIPEKEMGEIIAIAMRMGSMKILCEIPFKDKTLTELDVRGKNLGTEGALVVAEYLDGNRAMTKLDASDNSMFGKKDKAGITAWADALKANTSITKLNLGRNGISAADMRILAPAITDNGALTSLNLSSISLNTKGAESIN